MKILKKIFKVILALILLLVLALLIIVAVDYNNTSYLKVKNNQAAKNNSYIIKNVNIIPMHIDTVLTNKMVYVKEGVIQQIADHIKVENIEVFDGQQKYLSPGLIDMHVHVWDKYELGLYLSNGVTSVRNVWGMPMHLRFKELINNDEILAPNFYTTGPKLTGPEFIGDDNLNLISPEQAKENIKRYKEKGYDFIKTYYGLPKDIFDAVLEQTQVLDMDIVAHPSQKVPYSYHFNPQIKSIEHAEDIVQQPLEYTLDTVKLKAVISNFSNHKNTHFCPTLTVYNNIYQMIIDDQILSSEELAYMNPLLKEVDSKAQFDRWQNTKLRDENIETKIKNQHDFHLKIIKELNDAGGVIISGTDAGIGVTLPGFSLHKELAFYKEAGLSNYEVLKTATINASKTHKTMNDLGSIEVGKTANFILTEDNPLSDLSTLQKPSFVFIRGRKLDREQLNTFDQKANNRSNLIATGLRYVENMFVEMQ